MIANPPPSPLHVSELGKFEESDLTPEMMTAKDEHVSMSPRSWELTQGWWAVHWRPGYGPVAKAKAGSAPGEASVAARVLPRAWQCSRLAHSCLHPPAATSLTANGGHRARAAPCPGARKHQSTPRPSPRSSRPACALEHSVLRMFPHAVGSLNSSRPVRCSDTLCWFFLVLGLTHMVKLTNLLLPEFCPAISTHQESICV